MMAKIDGVRDGKNAMTPASSVWKRELTVYNSLVNAGVTMLVIAELLLALTQQISVKMIYMVNV